MEAMEADFRKLKEAGINSVAALTKWMVDANVIDDAIETAQKVEKMFQDVSDQSNVELAKFLEVVTALAQERAQSADHAVQQLASALSAGAAAFIEAVREDGPPAPSPPPDNK